MKLPILYHKAKNGDLRQWTVWSEGDTILTEYGQVGGKLQTSVKKAVPKNVGRSNETTASEQARLESESLWRFKVERKYSDTPEAAQEELMLPMLAHKYGGSKKNKFQFPADIQPKLDGCRTLCKRIDDKIILLSRSGKEYYVPHITEQLDQWLTDDTTLDGELYIHGKSCQYITSLIKSANSSGRSYKPESLQLEYHIYDLPVIDNDETLSWIERRMYLQHLATKRHPGISVVDTWIVDKEQDIWNMHGKFLTEGYEGAILRAHDGKYLWGYRSSELLKVKQFCDAEFLVVGAKEGKGKMVGAVIWTCQNNPNNFLGRRKLPIEQFDVSMKTTMKERREFYENRDQYIGKMLTIRYFDLTDSGIPRFPVGLIFRDMADLP